MFSVQEAGREHGDYLKDGILHRVILQDIVMMKPQKHGIILGNGMSLLGKEILLKHYIKEYTLQVQVTSKEIQSALLLLFKRGLKKLKNGFKKHFN